MEIDEFQEFGLNFRKIKENKRKKMNLRLLKINY